MLFAPLILALGAISAAHAHRVHSPTPGDLSGLTVGPFAVQLFKTLFFQGNLTLVNSTFDANVAPDALININGQDLPPQVFLGAVNTFHAIRTATLVTPITTPGVVPLDSAGQTGVVAEQVITKQVSIDDGTHIDQVAVAILRVEMVNGKRLVTNWVEVQQDTVTNA